MTRRTFFSSLLGLALPKMPKPEPRISLKLDGKQLARELARHLDAIDRATEQLVISGARLSCEGLSKFGELTNRLDDSRPL